MAGLGQDLRKLHTIAIIRQCLIHLQSGAWLYVWKML